MLTMFASASAALNNEVILSRRALVTAAAASLAATGAKPEEALAFVPSRVADLSALHDQPLATSIICAAGDEACETNRQTLAREQLKALSAELGASTPKDGKAVDWAGHSSAFGMAPPPIQGILTYDEMLELAAAGEIATVQIAVQHDTVIATMRNGHRFASPIKDADFPWFVTDATRPDGTVPFEVLPIDPIRQKVRAAAFDLMAIMGVLYGLDELDLLPWDTNNYGSLEQREEAKEQVRRGEGLPSKPKVADAVRAFLTKRQAAKPDDKAGEQGGQGEEPWHAKLPKLPKLPNMPNMPELPGLPGVDLGKMTAWLEERLAPGKHAGSKSKQAGSSSASSASSASSSLSEEEALKRVLGLSKWDAAEELRAKEKAAKAGEAQQKMVERWHSSNYELKASVLKSKAHKTVVAAHERYIVQPHEAMVSEIKHEVEEIRQMVRAAPWLTPLTVDMGTPLPTLEQLMRDAHQIGSDGLVAQYIRAHPRLEELAVSSASSSPAAASSVPALLKLAKTAAAAPAVRGKDVSGDGFESELDGRYSFCRLCPEFSALYGHRVYICKQPVAA